MPVKTWKQLDCKFKLLLKFFPLILLECAHQFKRDFNSFIVWSMF